MKPFAFTRGPLRASIAGWAMTGGAVCLLLLAGVFPARGQTEDLLDRINNERIRKFEAKLTDTIGRSLSRYVSPSQYVLSVKVIWNKNIIPVTRDPSLQLDKQKLPGFPIFVGSPGTEQPDEAAPPYVRMVVRVLLDETLPEYYERFIRKITPIVARFDSGRGDQVIVVKETFPVRQKEAEPPPTLPEKELLEQLGTAPSPFQGPPQPRAPGPLPAAARGQPPIPRPNPMEAAQVAYDEGRYQDALRTVQFAFQRATTNQERALYLGMEGSVLFTLENQSGALAAWRRALTYDPTNTEVQRALRFLEQKQGEKAP